MHVPVMQQEWQRRQTQRSVWMLLGLLAVVSSATPAATAVVAPPPAATLATLTGERLEATESAPQTTRSVSQRYWRQLAPVHDGQARLRLGCQATPYPRADSLTHFLRRFVRPPTR